MKPKIQAFSSEKKKKKRKMKKQHELFRTLTTRFADHLDRAVKENIRAVNFGISKCHSCVTLGNLLNSSLLRVPSIKMKMVSSYPKVYS